MLRKKVKDYINKVLFPKPERPIPFPIRRPPGLIELSNQEREEQQSPLTLSHR